MALPRLASPTAYTRRAYAPIVVARRAPLPSGGGPCAPRHNAAFPAAVIRTPGRVIESLTPIVIAYCCVVMIVAYSVRGASGFGAAAALPLLGLALPLKLLVPAWTLVAIVAGAALLGSDRHRIAWAEMRKMVPGLLVGIAIGLLVFANLSTEALTKGLGAFVLIYGLFAMWSTFRSAPPKVALPPRALAFAGGGVGGFIGTVTGTFGSIFFAIYYDAIKLAKDQYRATITAIMLLLGVTRGIGYWAIGEFSREVLLLAAFLFPSMMVGTLIGMRIHHGMSDLAFRRTVAGALIASGLALLAK